MKVTYSFKSSCIFVFLIILLLGCSRSYEVHGFKANEVKYKWGVVGARLLGTEKIVRNTAIKSSPYELLVWFGSDNPIEGIIKIAEIKLVYVKDKEEIFSQIPSEEKLIKKESQNFRAYFHFENIETEYEEMVLIINFSIKQQNKTSVHQAVISFEKDYQEFRRIIGV